jgi:O-methyltransferase
VNGVVFRPGYFPDSAAGLEEEVFSLVMLDVDLYKPTLAGLTFFYPRLSPGGYLFIHDYTNVESDHAVSRATEEFMADKPEALIESPDMWGTVILRRNRV